MNSAVELTVVVPMRNEAACIAPLFARLLPVLESVTPGWEVICVNDGSSDGTLDALKAALARRRSSGRGPLSRGHAPLNTLLSGAIVPDCVSDFRLLGRCVVEAIRRFLESHRFT